MSLLHGRYRGVEIRRPPDLQACREQTLSPAHGHQPMRRCRRLPPTSSIPTSWRLAPLAKGDSRQDLRLSWPTCRSRSLDGTHAASAFSMLVELMAIATSGLIGAQIDLPHG